MKWLRTYIKIVLILIIISVIPFSYINTKKINPQFIKRFVIYKLSNKQNMPFLISNPFLDGAIISAYNNAETVKEPVVFFPDYVIKVETGYFINRTLFLHLDPENMTGNIKMLGIWGDTRKLCKTDVASLLSFEPFFKELVLPSLPMPEINITLNGNKTYIQPKIIEWKYPYPSGDGEYRLSSPPKKNNTANLFKVSPGDTFSLLVPNILPPDKIILIEKFNGTTTTTELKNNSFKIPALDGKIDYKLSLSWGKKQYPNSYGIIECDFSCLVDIPPTIKVSSNTVRPGYILSIFVKNLNANQQPQIKTPLYSGKVQFAKYEEGMLALIPVNWWTKPGKYYIDLSVLENNKVIQKNRLPITVLKDNFEVTYQYLIVSSELKKKTSLNASINDSKYINGAKAHSSQIPLWSGKFILPVNGSIGTPYAKTRYINGKDPYRHSGLDISASLGTPVKAANSGKVVLAMELIRTGNTVIIDHGLGLFSSYCHLASISTKVGNIVKKGDLIGRVGSTGFSTGPHLHWSITLDGEYMDPNLLIKKDLLSFN